MEGPPPSPQSSVSSSSAARPMLSTFVGLHEYNEPPSVCWYCSQTFCNRFAFAGHHNAHTMSKRSANTTADQGSANAQQQPDMAMLDPPTVDLPPFTSTCIYKPPQGYRRGLQQQIQSAPRCSYRPSIRSIVQSAIPRPTQTRGVKTPAHPNPNPSNFTHESVLFPSRPNPNPSNFTHESVLFPSRRLAPTIHNSVIHPPNLFDSRDREVERAVECTPYEPKVITQNAPLVIGPDLTTGNYITLPADVQDRKGKKAIEDILYESRGITRNAPLSISSGSTTGNFNFLDKNDKSCVVDMKDFAPLMKPYLDRENMRHLLVTEHSGPTMVETYIGVGEEEEAKAKGLDLSLHL